MALAGFDTVGLKGSEMPKFVTIGYGDEVGYERTAPEVRDAAHAHDATLVHD
jgi:hypothetical protein